MSLKQAAADQPEIILRQFRELSKPREFACYSIWSEMLGALSIECRKANSYCKDSRSAPARYSDRIRLKILINAAADSTADVAGGDQQTTHWSLMIDLHMAEACRKIETKTLWIGFV